MTNIYTFKDPSNKLVEELQDKVTDLIFPPNKPCSFNDSATRINALGKLLSANVFTLGSIIKEEKGFDIETFYLGFLKEIKDACLLLHKEFADDFSEDRIKKPRILREWPPRQT